MTRRLRTGTYSQEARWRLARAIAEARKAAGHPHRPTFYKAAGIGKRSLEAAESLEPDAPSVGETVLRAIGRALPTWTEDTPRIILEGGEIPANNPPTAETKTRDLAPLDEVLTANSQQLATLARMHAWYMAERENREPDVADEDTFLAWAVDVRKQRRGIKPSGDGKRDVS